MIINRANLTALNVAFNAAFREGLGLVEPMWSRVATDVPSTTSTEEYGWLGDMPNVREWIGDRQVQNIRDTGYRIKNRSWEHTIGVKREQIEDDQIGHFSTIFRAQGEAVGGSYDQQTWGLFNAGFTTICFDGQYFFDTDHPVIAADGTTKLVANTDGGSGTPWFLIDDRRVLKPLILQIRKKWNFVSKDKDTDDNVFDRAEYVYGVDGRFNVGFGFWQTAWGSKQDLTPTTFANAYTSLQSMTGDYGRPLAITPRLLIVPPKLAPAARTILNAENNAAGATNIWRGSAELLVCPWLV